jgi:hypothetical protein
MPQVSERHATFNYMDVVCRAWCESNVYLFLLLYERFLIFFCLSTCRFCPIISLMLH